MNQRCKVIAYSGKVTLDLDRLLVLELQEVLEKNNCVALHSFLSFQTLMIWNNKAIDGVLDIAETVCSHHAFIKGRIFILVHFFYQQISLFLVY